MEQSPASKSHFWAALFKPHISILDISAEEGPHLIGDYLRPFYQQQDARTAPCQLEIRMVQDKSRMCDNATECHPVSASS